MTALLLLTRNIRRFIPPPSISFVRNKVHTFEAPNAEMLFPINRVHQPLAAWLLYSPLSIGYSHSSSSSKNGKAQHYPHEYSAKERDEAQSHSHTGHCVMMLPYFWGSSVVPATRNGSQNNGGDSASETAAAYAE